MRDEHGRLAGKTLFITGGSRGIGLAIALRAARDGANVAIAAKTAEPHPKLPGTIHSAAAEIERRRRPRAAARLRHPRRGGRRRPRCAATAKRFGGIDILVNNASAISLTGTLATPMKRFDLMFGVNVRGTFALLAGLPAASREVRGRGTQSAHPDAVAAAQHRRRAGSATTSPTRWRNTA